MFKVAYGTTIWDKQHRDKNKEQIINQSYSKLTKIVRGFQLPRQRRFAPLSLWITSCPFEKSRVSSIKKTTFAWYKTWVTFLDTKHVGWFSKRNNTLHFEFEERSLFSKIWHFYHQINLPIHLAFSFLSMHEANCEHYERVVARDHHIYIDQKNVFSFSKSI